MLTRIIKLVTITATFLALQSCLESGGYHEDTDYEHIHILRDSDSTETATSEEIVVESGAVEQDSI
jgi:hypothetical protein